MTEVDVAVRHLIFHCRPDGQLNDVFAEYKIIGNVKSERTPKPSTDRFAVEFQADVALGLAA